MSLSTRKESGWPKTEKAVTVASPQSAIGDEKGKGREDGGEGKSTEGTDGGRGQGIWLLG